MNIPVAVAHNLAMGLGPVRRLARRRHHTGINRDPARVESEYAFLSGFSPVMGQRILELGPGQTPDLLLRALDEGARSAAAADITDYLSDDASAARIDYRLFSGDRLPFDRGAFDLVWAIDVLEHVRHPQRVLEQVSRVLAPGGAFVCKIDLRDHFFLADESRWLECLRYPDWLWAAMTWNRSNFVNRWRRSHWSAGFTAAGLTVERETVHRSEQLAALRPRLAFLQRFSEEDVAVYRIDACLRAPALAAR